MKFALIKERKNIPDRRVVLSPQACGKLINDYPECDIVVEPSDIRIFKDEEYSDLGINVSKDIIDADVLLGVKEVPIEALMPNKKYFFFSHTIKKQPHNRALLKAILDKKIEFYDHETVVDEHDKRLIGFGYYAGVVGAYNGIRAYGLKFGCFDLPSPHDLKDQDELNEVLKKIKIPKIRIVLSGKGKVGKGAKEVLDLLRIREVTVDEYLNNDYNEPIYTNIGSMDYNERIDGQQLGKQDFYTHPERYKSTFMKFAKVSDLFIAGHFYSEGAPFLYTHEDVRSEDFNIKVVADISCDISGPVATTIRASSADNPIYGYNPQTGKEVDFREDDAIVVMAVDNLPSELPLNASDGFGHQFLEHVVPAFFNGDKDDILKRALIAKNGNLTERFAYLQDYVDGKQ